jgi:hypothetical protein
VKFVDQTTLRDDYLARLVATRFAPGRIKGRRALERDALRGKIVALARLEVMLGLADKSAVTDAYEAVADAWLIKAAVGVHHGQTATEILRLAKTPYGKRLPLIIGTVSRRAPGAYELRHLVPPEVLWNIERKQHKRKLLKEVSGPQEPTIERYLQNRLRYAMWRTDIRPTRRHTKIFKFVPPGEERVASRSDTFWVAGKRFPRTSSEHEWYVSRAMISPETRELQKQNRKRVYLTPEKRVRGGRGSALVVEVLDKKRKRPRWIVQG